MPQHTLVSLSMAENAQVNCSDYANFLSIPQYSYNNIIIVTNFIILEFLSSQFVYPGTEQLTILSFQT